MAERMSEAELAEIAERDTWWNRERQPLWPQCVSDRAKLLAEVRAGREEIAATLAMCDGMQQQLTQLARENEQLRAQAQTTAAADLDNLSEVLRIAEADKAALRAQLAGMPSREAIAVGLRHIEALADEVLRRYDMESSEVRTVLDWLRALAQREG